MLVGINAAAAIKQPRTGVEEYCYQLLKHLTMLPESKGHRFILFVPKSDPNYPNPPVGGHPNDPNRKIPPPSPLCKGGLGGIFDFPLPENFEVKVLSWPLPMWTQVRLTSHMVGCKPDVLFIPVHVLPLIHPKNSVVTIHGLEYEYFPEYYPFWFRNYLRWSTRYAVKHARKIIAVSENTKRDLVKLYKVEESRVAVVYHGAEIQKSKNNAPHPPLKLRGGAPPLILRRDWEELKDVSYLLYIGRIELKKNILGILEAYRILKEKYKIPHQLVLAGHPGFGYEIIKLKIKNLLEIGNWKLEIKTLGYVSKEQKHELLCGADAFIFPSFYEGFGLPILEAQSAGVPMVASNTSSIPEIVGDSAMLIDPKNPEQIAQAVYKIIDGKALHDKLIELGYENVKRFSWENCARKTLDILSG